MAGLQLYSSNRVEVLGRQLAEVLRGAPLPPMQPEIVVVQSKGMARWLAMEMADHLQVWANVRCPFPAALVDELFRLVLPEFVYPERRELTWRLMALLPELLGRSEFAPLRHYLADNGALKRYQLAGQLADLFDQYQIYRPDLVLAWDAGKADGWQAELWRRVHAGVPASGHRAALLKEFLRVLAAALPDGELATRLPRRISLFGVSSLPPYYLHVFAALAPYVDVAFYLLNPCREYWGEIRSEREIARARRRHGQTADELYQETGNSLLASMGQLGRDFFGLLYELEIQEHDRFEAPPQAHLLGRIQADILQLREAGDGPPVPGDDASIRLVSCHSPQREVEALRDHLLALFDQHGDLAPRDILVMTPDIETYSPYIEAVFDVGPQDPLWIPYSIADRGMRQTGRLVDAFLAVLELARGRFGVSQVLKVMESPLVARRFGLSSTELELVEEWVAEVNIRWGMDGEHQRELGLPVSPANTWRAGLDRLLLGYAMGEGDQVFADLLPFARLAGETGDVVGRFVDCASSLVAWARRLQQPYTLAGWSALLNELVVACLAPGEEDESEAQVLRGVLHELAVMEEQAAFAEQLTLEVMLAHLRGVLEKQGAPFGFLTGGLTFCAMLPMRAIPAKVVCLLGMNDADFPRPEVPLSFDLMAREPRRGDRSRRHVDRYLFLESILSARQQLYVSYTGQSQKDERHRPPSVLVSELMDYMTRLRRLSAGTDPAAGAASPVVCQRLQPFHPDYFRPGSGLFSYSRENFEAARVEAGGRPAGPLFVAPLAELPADWQTVNVDRLCGFFAHPVRAFCQARLGIRLEEVAVLTDEQEPMALDGLSRYRLEEEALAAKLGGRELGVVASRVEGAGGLPHGAVGEMALLRTWNGVGRMQRRLAPHVRMPVGELDIDLLLGEFRLTGQFRDLRENGLVRYRPAKVKTADLLGLWIRHLILQVSGPERDWRSIHVGRDAVYAVGPVAGARELLADLLAVYLVGQRQPLLLLPRSSMIYVETLNKGKSTDEAMAKAAAEYQGGAWATGEGEEPYYRLCFRDWPPWAAPEFAALAERCLGPLVANLSREGK